MSKLYLVRHGITDWNREGRAQGQTDTPLSDEGHEQMTRLRERLTGIAFAAAYASDLRRAAQSAGLLMKGRGVEVNAVGALREISYGSWEGLTFPEAQTRAPLPYSRFITGDVAAAAPEGESVEDLMRRVRPFAESLRSHHPYANANVLVVAHGGSLRAMLVSMLGLPLHTFWKFALDPASLSVVNLLPEGAVLERWNDTGHLGGTE